MRKDMNELKRMLREARMDELQLALDRENYHRLGLDAPEVLEAIEAAVMAGQRPKAIRDLVQDEGWEDLAARCESAARYAGFLIEFGVLRFSQAGGG